jgi:hypothetical protein
MKNWAGENMECGIDDRLVERWIDDLVAEDLFVPE